MAAARLAQLILLVLFVLAGQRVFRQLAGTVTAQAVPGVEGLEQALQWDAEQPQIHHRLGLHHRDQLEHYDPERALDYLQRAVGLNPYNWNYLWDLARCLEIAGQLERAEEVYLQAIDLSPRHVAFRWDLANFYVRRDRLPEALPHFSAVLEFAPPESEYESRLFHLLWKLGTSVEQLSAVWRHNPGGQRRLIRYLMERVPPGGQPADPRREDVLAAVRQAWADWLESKEGIAMSEAQPILGFLFALGHVQETRRYWVQLTARLGVHDREYERGENLVWDGDFRPDPPGGIFDWQLGTPSQVRLERTGEGLKIDFLGKENLHFLGPRQEVVIEPGRAYEFSFEARSADISTDEGPYFHIGGSRGDLLQTRAILGTTDWTRYSGVFRAPEGVPVIFIQLRRNPSLRLGNRIAGTLWVRSVAIRER